MRLFSQVGLFEAIASGLIPDPKVVYVNERGRTLMEMEPPRSPFGHSPLGIFYQPTFERVLLAGVGRFETVQAAFAHNVTDLIQDEAGVTLSVAAPYGERLLRAEFVVACDGGASTMRDKIGVRMLGSTYMQRWLVVDARIENHGVDKITFRGDPQRPSVQLLAVGSRVRWSSCNCPAKTPTTWCATIRSPPSSRLSSPGPTSRSNERPSTPFTRGSPIGGAAAESSSPAMQPT